MTVTDLTKKLITLQSFDDGNLYEKPVSDFLIEYVKEKFPWLQITVQEVAPNRCNILLTDDAPTRLLVVDQIDTVIPSQGWLGDPLVPVERDGKLYGLGASDSKGNLAAFLTALGRVGKTKGLGVLLYVDEEYFFAGMKAFINSTLSQTMNPAYVLSIDGSGAALGTGCRGLVEFDLSITSLSGHSANPKTLGALRPFMSTLQGFSSWLESYKSPKLGSPTVNVAFVRSGLLLGENEQGLIFANEGNRVPNFLQAKIEIRTTPELSWRQIKSFWSDQLGLCQGLKFNLEPVFDFAGFSTPLAALGPIEQAVVSVTGAVSYLDASCFGYLDMAMLSQVFSEACLCSFGIGEPGVVHKANEFVRVTELERGERIYEQLLKTILA